MHGLLEPGLPAAVASAERSLSARTLERRVRGPARQGSGSSRRSAERQMNHCEPAANINSGGSAGFGGNSRPSRRITVTKPVQSRPELATSRRTFRSS